MQRRRLALLALLVGARRGGITRDKLVAFLWPDSNMERARHLLSDSIYRINQAVGGEAVVAVGDALRLNPERLSCDVLEFADAMAADDFARAIELYTAPFLDGFFLTAADELERWVETERDRLARERARALEALVDEAEAQDDATAAVHWARTLAAHDPFSSRFVLRCMHALERAGERAAALQHARVHTLLMRNELGLEPDEAVVLFEERLRAGGGDEAGQGGGGAGRSLRPGRAAAVTADRNDGPGGTEDEHEQSQLPGAPRPAAGPGAGPGPPSPKTIRVATVRAELLPETPVRSTRRRFLAPAALLGAIAALLLITIVARPSAAPTPTSMAVLPFADLSPAGDQEYFADGITEELIVRLARIDGMNVVGRTSAFALKGSDADVREIADRLGVDAVLAGSVRRAGDRLRVVAQLVDARSGYELWAETYEREMADVFAIQDEIARAIVTRLRGGLSGADSSRLVATGTDDLEAYNLYLRGRFEWHRRSAQSLRDAARYFEMATRRAPDYARAWVGLGDAYAVLGFYDYLPPAEAFPRAAEAARRALRLAPDLAEAHATLGYVALYHEFDWARAEAEFQRVVELDPDYSVGRQWYANHLTAMGRFDEAEREMRAAQVLDPLSLIANAALGWVLYYAGDYERAIAQCTRTLELSPEFELAYLWRGLALEALGRYDEELRDLARAVQLSDSSAITVAALARAYAVSGQRSRALQLARQLEARAYVPSFEMAKVYAGLGDDERALDWLERAYEERSHSMAFLAVDPQLRRLSSRPRFQRLVAALKL